MFAMKKECSGTFDLFTSSWRHVNPVLSWSLDCLVNSYFKAASISSEDMAYLPIEHFFSHNQFFVSTSIFNAEIFILLASKSMMTRWYFMHIYTRSETDRNMIPAYCIQNEWNIFPFEILPQQVVKHKNRFVLRPASSPAIRHLPVLHTVYSL